MLRARVIQRARKTGVSVQSGKVMDSFVKSIVNSHDCSGLTRQVLPSIGIKSETELVSVQQYLSKEL